MRKFKILTAALALCSIFSFNAYLGGSNIKNASAEASEFPCTISAAPMDKSYMCYGSSAVVGYTAEEAAAAGIPEGYEGQVYEVQPLDGGVSCGALLDFSASNISLALVESLEFRIYIPYNASNTGNRPQMRIAKPFDVNNAWIYQPGSTPTPAGEWTTVVVEKDYQFSSLADEDGNLYKFELSVRSNVKQSFYVDAISVNLKVDDGVAPVINYNGADTIYANEGTQFDLNVTAYDELEARNVDVEYVWNTTPFDADGNLVYGTYSLTLVAKDGYGNTSERTLTLVVEEADNEAPVISCAVTEMYAVVGTIPVLNIEASDDSGSVSVTRVWSDGALAKSGSLTEGTHTLTITAIDPSGNKATHTITIYVTAEEDFGDNVVDEENMIPRYTVTFDGENATQYKKGEKIEKPDDPTPPAENYTFVGWYIGETEWNFDSDVVTGDLNLVAKWDIEEISSESESSADSSSEESSEDEESSVPTSSSVTSSVEESSSSVETSSEEESSSSAGGLNFNCFGSVGMISVLPLLLGAAVLLKKKENE